MFPDGTIIRLLPGEQVEPAKLKVAEKREIFVETERALRAVVREVYAARFRETGAQRIEEALPERERESLARALRAVGKRAAAISTSSKLSSTPVKAKPVASATLNGRAARPGLGSDRFVPRSTSRFLSSQLSVGVSQRHERRAGRCAPVVRSSLDSGQADDKSAILGLKCKSQEKCKARKRPQY